MRYFQFLVFAAVALSVASGATRAEDRGVAVRASTPASGPTTGVAALLEPSDGLFVYSTQPPPKRPSMRFAIGQAPRSDYTIFSAEEQHGLDELRERMAAQQVSAARVPVRAVGKASVGRSPKRVTACAPAAQTDRLAALAWPKVVEQGEKVCVPRLEFADQADWRDHLWCFSKGDGSVR